MTRRSVPTAPVVQRVAPTEGIGKRMGITVSFVLYQPYLYTPASRPWDPFTPAILGSQVQSSKADAHRRQRLIILPKVQEITVKTVRNAVCDDPVPIGSVTEEQRHRCPGIRAPFFQVNRMLSRQSAPFAFVCVVMSKHCAPPPIPGVSQPPTLAMSKGDGNPGWRVPTRIGVVRPGLEKSCPGGGSRSGWEAGSGDASSPKTPTPPGLGLHRVLLDCLTTCMDWSLVSHHPFW